MRISDWSSDVCSSDLLLVEELEDRGLQVRALASAEEAVGSLESWEPRSEEHTSELQSLMRIPYAVFCLKKKKKQVETARTDTPPNPFTDTNRHNPQYNNQKNSRHTFHRMTTAA